jgi:hypothetical protein
MEEVRVLGVFANLKNMKSSRYWCEKLSELLTEEQARQIYLRHNRRVRKRERSFFTFIKKLINYGNK